VEFGEAVAQMAGKVLTAYLREMTDAIYGGADDALAFNEKAIDKARAAFKHRFGRAKLFTATDIPLPIGTGNTEAK
jgi:hypothetical protein